MLEARYAIAPGKKLTLQMFELSRVAQWRSMDYSGLCRTYKGIRIHILMFPSGSLKSRT